MIQAHQISKQFRLSKAQQKLEGRSSQIVQALHPMSFELELGDLLLILGTKNAGKSTLLHLLGGLIAPDSGNLQILGHDAKEEAKAIRAKTGWVRGNQAIFPQLTVVEQLRYFGQLQGLKGDLLKNRLEAVLDRWQLNELRNRRTKQLSAKERRYLAIAQALLHEPQLLLLDEPSFGLDIFNSYPVIDLIQYAKQNNITTVLATNNLSKAELMGDQLAVLHQGQLIYFDPLAKFKAERTENTLSEAFIGLIEAVR
jgi:sodium transport system ATP-binding protein